LASLRSGDIVFQLDIVIYYAIIVFMKALSIDLRERIVRFVKDGGTKADAARNFNICWRTAQRYCKADKAGCLAPKRRPGRKRTFESESLRLAVARNNDATLKEHAKVFGVSHNAIWKRLRQMAITLKKNSCVTPRGTRRRGGSSARS
jgi:transposase